MLRFFCELIIYKDLKEEELIESIGDCMKHGVAMYDEELLDADC